MTFIRKLFYLKVTLKVGEKIGKPILRLHMYDGIRRFPDHKASTHLQKLSLPDTPIRFGR